MIVDELYRENIDGHEQYIIIWKDAYLEGDTHPMSTEFIVRENESSGKDDDFLYKVVIYIKPVKLLHRAKHIIDGARNISKNVMKELMKIK